MKDMKWAEGRTTLFGLKSKGWHERKAACEARALEREEASNEKEKPEDLKDSPKEGFQEV